MNLLLFFCETLFFWIEDDLKKLKTVKISDHKVSQMTSSFVHHLFLFFYGLILQLRAWKLGRLDVITAMSAADIGLSCQVMSTSQASVY